MLNLLKSGKVAELIEKEAMAMKDDVIYGAPVDFGSFEEFSEKYGVVPRSGEEFLFEPFGDELKTIRRCEKNHVWTVWEASSGDQYLSPGFFKTPNTLNYVLTKEPWVTGDESFLFHSEREMVYEADEQSVTAKSRP